MTEHGIPIWFFIGVLLLVYGILIHLRVTYGWKGARFAWYALFAVALVFVAYFGVNLLFGASQHVFTVPPPAP